MNLFRHDINTDIRLINLDFVKEIYFKQRVEFVNDKNVYFYELFLDTTPVQKFYFSDFEKKLNAIKLYTDEEYSDFFDFLCELSSTWVKQISNTSLILKKLGWSNIKTFFKDFTYSNSTLNTTLVTLAFQSDLRATDLYRIYWGLYYLIL